MALAVQGCATAGTALTPAQRAFITNGATTEREVRAQLGEPRANLLMTDGRRLLVYDFARAASTWATPVPYAGPLFGGATIRHQALVLLVSPDGLVEQHLLTDDQMPLDIGLLIRFLRPRAQQGSGGTRPISDGPVGTGPPTPPPGGASGVNARGAPAR